MALLGYARTSCAEQNIGPQIEALRAAGCDRIYQEQRSGVDASRPELQSMLDYCREDDVIVSTRLDRIGRSTGDILKLLENLESRGVSFRCLNINLDTTTPTGKLMVTLLSGIAAFERDIMLERQRDGIAAAKAAGKYKGRKPTAMAKAGEVKELLALGLTKQTVADRVGIGIASVYRISRANREVDHQFQLPEP